MIFVRVIGLENSLRVISGDNIWYLMIINDNKSDSYYHLLSFVIIYFATQVATLDHIQGSVFDVCVPGCPASTIVFERR